MENLLPPVGAMTIGVFHRLPKSSQLMSTLETSLRRRGRSWNFRKALAIGTQRDLVVDAEAM